MSTIKTVIKRILPDIAVDVIASVQSYRHTHGVYPNLVRPTNFNEKVIVRSLFDNRPILRQFSDKYAVRSFVSERLGESVLPELYCVTTDPKDIPFSRLPSAFVVKPSHGSGWVRIVRDKQKLDHAELIRECEYWLSQDFYKIHRERVYRNIPPRILVEELIDDGSELAPTDYKFNVFHGKVEVIAVIFDRFINTRGYFLDRDWTMLKGGLSSMGADSSSSSPPADIPKPPHLDDMIRAAETLSRDIDFVRADFYDTPRKYYFGELTTTPGAGLERWDPPEFNNFLGKLW